VPLHRPSNKLLAHILLLAVVSVWGGTFVVVKDALANASPLVFNLLRMALATVALLAINHRYLRGLSRRDLASGVVAGLFLAGGYQFQTLGLARTTPVKSAFITGLVVVLVPILTTIPALRPQSSPPPRWPTALGALLGFAGLALLTTPSGASLGSVFTSMGFGDLLTLLCALAFAGHLLALAHLAPAMPVGRLALLQIAACTAVMLLTLPLGGSPVLHLTPGLVLALAITGLLGTAAAFTIQSWAQQFLPPANTAMILTLEPVVALLVSVLFLHERPSLRSISGAGLILLGIVAVELLALPQPIPIEPA
jgi:drug/metabolite transporter (DMT)-like permease